MYKQHTKKQMTDEQVLSSLNSRQGVSVSDKDKAITYTRGTLGIDMLGRVDYLRKKGWRVNNV